MKKKNNQYQIDTLFDWEADDFLTRSISLLGESETYGLYREDKEGEHRSFASELEAWIDKWKS